MALLLESQEDSYPKLDDDRKLTPNELDVLRLAMIDRIFDEIAARLGITEGEALWRFQAARNKLGWELSPHSAAKRPAGTGTWMWPG